MVNVSIFFVLPFKYTPKDLKQGLPTFFLFLSLLTQNYWTTSIWKYIIFYTYYDVYKKSIKYVYCYWIKNNFNRLNLNIKLIYLSTSNIKYPVNYNRTLLISDPLGYDIDPAESPWPTASYHVNFKIWMFFFQTMLTICSY